MLHCPNYTTPADFPLRNNLLQLSAIHLMDHVFQGVFQVSKVDWLARDIWTLLRCSCHLSTQTDLWKQVKQTVMRDGINEFRGQYVNWKTQSPFKYSEKNLKTALSPSFLLHALSVPWFHHRPNYYALVSLLPGNMTQRIKIGENNFCSAFC